MKVFLSLLLSACLLCAGMAVSADRYDFTNGIPEDWTHFGSDDVKDVTATSVLDPVNPNASQQARNLYAYLSTLSDTQTMLSGQFDIKTNDYAYQTTVEEFGLHPALYSTRYTVDTSTPVWVTDANGEETPELAAENAAMDFLNVDAANTLLKRHYDNGNVLLIHSDGAIRSVCIEQAQRNNPDLYTDYTNCIRELDETNPDRDLQVYALWKRFQSNEIEALRQLEDMGVDAYLWRTWVEFNYNAFFGADEEGYAHFVRVYQQTVDAMIDSGLKGFLVCYSPGAKSNTLQRYPGNEYIDTVAVTLYSEHELGGKVSAADIVNYEWYVRTGKPLGLSEWSCRTGAWQETASRPRASSFELVQNTVSYFPAVTWVDFWDGDGYWPLDLDGADNGNDDGLLYLESPFVLTLDEIVDYRTTSVTAPGVVQLFATATGDGGYVGLEERSYAASDLKALGVDLTKTRSLRLNTDYSITFYSGKDCTGTAYPYGSWAKNISAAEAKKYRSCVVQRLQNIALEQNEIYASVNDDDAWRANDGLSSLWEGDVLADENSAQKGTAWLMLDLGDTYRVGHYVLRLVGYAGRLEQYNIAEYQLQYSNDGETWTTVDHVKENTLSQLDRYFNPVTARYFRVLVLTPNRALAETDRGFVCISELELFGLQQALAQNDAPSDPESDDMSADEESEPDADDKADSEPKANSESESEEEDRDDTQNDGSSDEETPSQEDVPVDDSVSDGDADVPQDDVTDFVTDDLGDDTLPEDTEGDADSADDRSEETDGSAKKPVQIVTTETYFPWWAFLLIGVGVSAVAAVVILMVVRKKKNVTQ